MSFRALYPSACEECEAGIEPGQIVHHMGVGTYVHNQCPRTTACPKCFTMPAVNGRCACED